MVEEVVGSLLGIEMAAIALSIERAAVVAHAVDMTLGAAQQGRIDKVFAGAAGHRGREGAVVPGRHVVEGRHVEGSWIFEPRRLGACEAGRSEAVGREEWVDCQVVVLAVLAAGVVEGNRFPKVSPAISIEVLVLVEKGWDRLEDEHFEDAKQGRIKEVRISSVPPVFKVGGRGKRAPSGPARQGVVVVVHEVVVDGIAIPIDINRATALCICSTVTPDEVGRIRIGCLVGSSANRPRRGHCMWSDGWDGDAVCTRGYVEWC